MPHNIVPLKDDNSKMKWCLDDASHPLLRIEPGLAFYKDNDEVKVTSFANTVGALINMGRDTPATFYKADSYGCLYRCADDSEDLFAESYIVDPSTRTLYFSDPKPCSVVLEPEQWNEFLKNQYATFPSGRIIYHSIESEAEENQALSAIIPQNDIWKDMAETGILPQIEEYAIVEKKWGDNIVQEYIVSYNLPNSENLHYSVMSKEGMQEYLDILNTSAAEHIAPEIGGAGATSIIDGNSQNPKLTLNDDGYHLLLDGDDVGNVVSIPDTLQIGEEIEILVECNTGEESISSIYPLAVTNDLIDDLMQKKLTNDDISVTGLKAHCPDTEISQNIYDEVLQSNTLKTFRFDEQENLLTVYCSSIENDIVEIENPIIINKEPLQISSRAENGALMITELSASSNMIEKLEESLAENNKFSQLKDTQELMDMSHDSFIRLAAIVEDKIQNDSYLQLANGKLISSENIKFFNPDLGIAIEDKGGDFAIHLAKDPIFSNPDMPINIAIQNPDDIVFLSESRNFALSRDGVVMSVDDSQKEALCKLMLASEDIKNYGDIFVREDANLLESYKENASIVPLDTSPMLTDIKIENTDAGVVVLGHETKVINQSDENLENNTKIIYLKSIQIENHMDEKTLHLIDKDGTDYTVGSFFDKDLSVHLFVENSKDMLGVGNYHDVFVLKDHDGVYTEYHGEYISLTSLQAPTVSKDDAEILAVGKIDTQLYNHIIDESALGAMSVKVLEDTSGIHVDLIRTGDTNNPGIFTREYITNFEMSPYDSATAHTVLSNEQIEELKTDYAESIPAKDVAKDIEPHEPQTIEELLHQADTFQPQPDDPNILPGSMDDFDVSPFVPGENPEGIIDADADENPYAAFGMTGFADLGPDPDDDYVV